MAVISYDKETIRKQSLKWLADNLLVKKPYQKLVIKEIEYRAKNHYTIAVDFDGTICTNAYPEIGKINYRLLHQIRVLQEFGIEIILWTCRDGEDLEKALAVCEENKVVFDAVNNNSPYILTHWGNSRKVFADEYWDDRAIYCKYWG